LHILSTSQPCRSRAHQWGWAGGGHVIACHIPLEDLAAVEPVITAAS
jgi:hypothetical protein